MFDFLGDFLTDVSNPDEFWSDAYGSYDTWGGDIYTTPEYGDVSDWGTGNSTWNAEYSGAGAVNTFEGSKASMFDDWGKLGKQALIGGSTALAAAAGQGRSGGLSSLASRSMGGIGGGRMPIQAMGDAKGPQALTSKSPDALHSYWMDKMRDFARWKATVAASDPDVKIGRK